MADSAGYYRTALRQHRVALANFWVSGVFWFILVAGCVWNFFLDTPDWMPVGVRVLLGFIFGYVVTYAAMKFLNRGRRYLKWERESLSWANSYKKFEEVKVTPNDEGPTSFGKIKIQ